MRVIKCDNCKKKISNDRDVIEARIGFWTHVELCVACGKPIYDLLEKMNLIHEKQSKKTKK